MRAVLKCSLQSQVDKIVGRGAPREFVDNLMSIANSHHEHLSVDCIRAYHFGSRFIVELEVLLPPQMTVEESHDIALFLQHKVSIIRVRTDLSKIDHRSKIAVCLDCNWL